MPRIILDWDTKYKKGIITSDLLDNIRAHFSVANPAKRFYPKNFQVQDFTSVITSTGRFELGMYTELVSFLQNHPTVKFEVQTTEPLKQVLDRGYPWKNKYEPASLKLDDRDYQIESIKTAIDRGYGIIVVGTAGGKTAIMATLTETVRKHSPLTARSFFILPAHLLEQTKAEFISYGIQPEDICLWRGEEEYIRKPITLASLSTLYSIFTAPRIPSNYTDEQKKEKLSQWKRVRSHYVQEIEDIELVIVDEVHGVRKDNDVNKIISMFNTPHKFGFTGTLPESPLDVWNAIGKIGPIIVDISSAQLRERGYIAQVKTHILRLHYKKPPRTRINQFKPTEAYEVETNFLYTNEYRNRVISHITRSVENNVLVLVDRLDHGELLKTIIEHDTLKKVFFVRGSVEMEDREKMRELMEQQNDVICIAMSKIFSMGVNIKNLHYLVFAQGGKAKITLIQSVGRGLRLHESKELLTIFDLADNTHYGKDHLEARLQHYRMEKIGYEIRDIYES